jgi:outer membrane protein OmpA-like peptidoglycan-associated protein
VNDPEFGLGSVIAKAFINIISKAVTAPFTLLANLVGSEEDMQRVSFSSGSSELDEAAKAKLTSLVQALDQRPALSLVLHGRLHPTADREQLQKALLREQLQASGLSEEDVSSKSADWVKAVGARYEVLEPIAAAADGESTPSMLQQYQRVLNSIPVGDEQLESLAEERAVSLKRFLVNELQFPVDRSVIEAVDVADEAHMFSGVELDVDI